MSRWLIKYLIKCLKYIAYVPLRFDHSSLEDTMRDMHRTRTNVQCFLKPITTWWSFIKSSTFQFCWVHPCQGEVIFPYPNLWLHSRFLFLDWLRLTFEEIMNYNRVTQQHFLHHPNSWMFPTIWHFGLRLFELSSKETLNNGDAFTFICCLFLKLDREHTESISSFIFFHMELLHIGEVSNILWKTDGRGLHDQQDWCEWIKRRHQMISASNTSSDTTNGGFAQVLTTWI